MSGAIRNIYEPLPDSEIPYCDVCGQVGTHEECEQIIERDNAQFCAQYQYPDSPETRYEKELALQYCCAPCAERLKRPGHVLLCPSCETIR